MGKVYYPDPKNTHERADGCQQERTSGKTTIAIRATWDADMAAGWTKVSEWQSHAQWARWIASDQVSTVWIVWSALANAC